MRQLLLSSILLATGSATIAMPTVAAALSLPADSSLLTENFSVNGNTTVPGTVLKSGNYVIRVVDHISDRSIIRIEKQDGKVLSTFLAVPNRKLAAEGSSGPVVWAGGSEHDRALRGFNFPGSYSVEFVYPKAEAVKIALSHAAAVEAIDPSSDNLPSKQKNLTNDDMRIVTLWTLSPTRVNGETAIAAQKYKPVEPAPVPQPVVARNEPPANLAPVRQARTAVPPPAAAAPEGSKPVPHRKPIAAVLPHTASELPLVLFAGLLSLFGIAFLRFRDGLVERSR